MINEWARVLSRRLPPGSFGRRLLVVSGGAASGQAITMLVAPVLTRLYGPEDLGVLAVYVSVISIFGVFCTFAYHISIPAVEDENEAANLLGVSAVGTVATSLLAGVVSLLLGERIAASTASPQLTRYIWLVPLGVLGIGLFEALSQWAVRVRAFGPLAKTSVSRSAVQAAVQVAAGATGLGAPGLLFAQVSGQWVGMLTLFRSAWRSSATALRRVTLRGARQAAAKHRRYPMFTLPASVINAVDAHSAPLLLSFFLGGTVTGWFALGHRVLAIPFWLVGSSSQKVFYAEAAEARQSGRLAEVTLAVFGRLLSFALPVMAILIVAGPELFSVVFGAEWREAGVYTQWLALRTTLTIVVFPITPLVYLLERQAAGTFFSAIQLVVRVGAVAVGGTAGDPRLAIALLGVGTGAVWVVYLAYLMSISGNHLSGVLAVAGREVAMTVPAIVPLAIVRAAGAPHVWVLGSALASGLIAVGVLLLREFPRRGGPPNVGRPAG